MSISRREFLRLSSLVAGGVALASCTPVYREAARWIETGTGYKPLGEAETRWLRRLTYGASDLERGLVDKHGIDVWIEDQLKPEDIDDPAAGLRLRKFDFLGLEANALVAWKEKNLTAEFKQVSLLRKVYSRRQIYEQLVEFWTDHFNIAIAKGDCWFLKVVDDREVIRQHALGNFRDLLWASAHSPAMLVYLDNQVNLQDAPNENYARELMELHTLGVDGGYTQKDVMELARCLTGWTVKNSFWRGDFRFNPDIHDPGVKTVLGQRIEPNGVSEAEGVLEYLATHPSTARFISEKLVRRFVTDFPDIDAPELTALAAAEFLRTDGDIPSVLKVIFQMDRPLERGLLKPKYKRPLDFVASAMRMSKAETDGGRTVQSYLAAMGQPLFEWPTPDGPPDLTDSWKSLLPRWRFALELSRGDIDGSHISYGNLVGGNLIQTTNPKELLTGLTRVLD